MLDSMRNVNICSIDRHMSSKGVRRKVRVLAAVFSYHREPSIMCPLSSHVCE